MTSDRRRRFALPSVLLGILAATGVAAESASTRVSYLAGGSVYVEAGRLEGLREGDTLSVIRDGARIAGLRVTYLSSHRASCDTLHVVALPRVGDQVRYESRPPEAPKAIVQPFTALTDSLAMRSTPGVGEAASRSPAYTYRGRVGLRYFSLEGTSAVAVQQPALDLRFDGTGLDGRSDLSADVRSRRTSSTLSDGSIVSDGQARVYRLALGLHDRRGRHRLTVGRQASAPLASVSLFDGVLLSSQGTRGSAGLFGGTQPDPVDFGFSSSILEYGAFAGLHSAPGTLRRWRVDLGGVSSYAEGQPNRDFLFIQGYLQDRQVSLSGTQEVDFNRGWKVAMGESEWSMTSTFLVARVQLVEPVAVRGGFDNRRNVRLYRDHLTPETEFDDRHRQGAWTGASFDFGLHLRLDGDYRARLGAERSHTWSGGFQVSRLGAVQGLVRCRYSIYRSDPTASELLSFGLGLDPLPGWHLEASGGTRTTTDRIPGIQERVTWQSADLDVALARRWYLSGSFGRDEGPLESTHQVHTGLSWSF